ncbi:hypothetical protein JZU46_03980 [bacterium]|jgi:hypothetical protein|nr:hypothetical protein [bacterium]
MKENRAFAGERCPHCGFWLVGVEGVGNWEWFCTVCGSQIMDDHLCDQMAEKSDQKVFADDRRESRGLGAPQKGNEVTVAGCKDFSRWKDNGYRERWFASQGLPFVPYRAFKSGVP